MAPKCEPLCCFNDRLYFTTFPHPAPNSETLNRLTTDTNYRPRVRPRPRGFPATSPDEHASYYYFTIDDQLLYLSFFQDWGPLNIAMVYKACILIHELLEDKDLAAHRLVLYSSNDPRSKANAALLMALYVMIVQRHAPWEAFHPIAEIEFMPFRDAGRGPSDFNLNIQDCLWGIWKAMQSGLCDLNEFDIEDYEFYEKVENGDWNWITPNFIAFASPVDQNWIKRQKEAKEVAGSALMSSTSSNLALQGKLPTPFLNCLDYFEKRNIKLVVRLNNELYDRGTFLDRGIDHMELYFDDGTNPTDDIVRTFLDVADRVIEEGGVVAVHCKAGLGRTATLIGAYLIWKHGFTANEAIAFMRIVRPGSVVGPQQQYLYLKQLEWSKWAAIDEARKIQSATAAASASMPTVVTPATPPADTDEELPLRPSTPTGSGSSLPLPPVTPSRHVAAAAAQAKAIAPPGQPRKTPKAKRAAHDSDDEDDVLGIRSDSDSDEMNDVLPSLHTISAAPSARLRARVGLTSKLGKSKVGTRGAITASEQRPTRVTRSTAGANVIRKTGTATGTNAGSRTGAAGPSVVTSPTKATTGQRPNKIPRLALGKSTVGLATKAAAAAKAEKPVPLPITMATRSKLNPPPPTPSRLPTLVPTKSRMATHHSNSASDAAAVALLSKKGVGAPLSTKSKDAVDAADAPAWMATGKAAGVVVTGKGGNKPGESRPGLRSSVRRRRSSFSSADVVA
ncbi:protein-tyrosine phosphatase-like protein [Rhodocollybia butyracea]|uniref:protein-tyrosine-phosphatase n=1 Tax=Rhodocollybia butyracea TaxID=206335 RepID=A0A9P5Q8C2_9AGAR|nr:protein-tyrosine phosphatase-like protein [Rhodocollybia butyracea]